jgi:hypothetical protein
MTDKPVTQQRPVKKEKVNFFFPAFEFNNPYGILDKIQLHIRVLSVVTVICACTAGKKLTTDQTFTNFVPCAIFLSASTLHLYNVNIQL